MLGRIQQRAFELFAGRGFASGHDVEDWVSAERELCWPATELAERGEELCPQASRCPGSNPAKSR